MYKYFDLANLPILSRNRKALQVSSYDREYENKDWGNYLYDIDETTSVIFDDPGCGCIKSIWMAVPSKEAFMDFYFDGEDTPRYTSSLFGFFNGECKELTGIGNTFEERGHWELADCRCGNCFIQIPYEKGLKIIVRGEEKEKCYYHIMYESYPDGILPCEGSKEVFEKSFSNVPIPKAELKKYTLVRNYNDLMTVESGGVIREMTLKVKEGTDLSKVMFYICFDHARAPQVSCPVSALFAQPIRWEDINSYALTSKCEDGYVTTSVYLPMPFFEKMYLGMIKLVPEDIDIEFGVVIEENNSYLTSAALQYHDYQGATCTVAGTCVYCGAKGSPLGHSYHAVVTPPTCTSQGYTTHTCAVCGDVYTDTYVEVQDHSYESVITAPICNAGGYTTYTCTVCGDSYVADYTDAAHPYQTVVTPPTC
ncbi:MAG: DUF2961 domain-containing protein, partial [Clostridia bacterium]|nr:DUF2961 domain-containing protein [Clostridia bacterium]